MKTTKLRKSFLFEEAWPTVTYNNITFVDAQGMSKAYDEFRVPHRKDLKGLEPGDHVKVRVEDQEEELWVEITFIEENIITGTIADSLPNHNLNAKDSIQFPEKCICKIKKMFES